MNGGGGGGGIRKKQAKIMCKFGRIGAFTQIGKNGVIRARG